MQDLHEHSQSNHVTALFADRALSFALPKGATLETWPTDEPILAKVSL
jgi:hypothetical protein